MIRHARLLTITTYAAAALLTGRLDAATAGVGPGPSAPGVRPAPSPRVVVPPRALRGVSAVSVPNGGGDLACATTVGGAVSCWGWHYAGAGSERGATVYSRATPVPGLSGAKALSVNASTCVVTELETVSCWGHYTADRIATRPTTVSGLRQVTATSSGSITTCALTRGGEVWCWGDNLFGTLGVGDKARHAGPVRVKGLPTVAQVSVGAVHACAVSVDRTVWCWGANPGGVLGRGGQESLRPVPVPGLTGVGQVVAGTDHTCAVGAGGVVRCWGANEHAQLGGGAATPFESTPVAVRGLSGVTSVAVGTDHTCAALVDGSAVCWGGNGAGQLGDGSSRSSVTPVAVRGPRGVTALSAGRSVTCARTSDGLAWCWGLNSSSALGSGSDMQPRVPVNVIASADPARVGGLSAYSACGATYPGREPVPALKDPRDAYSWECRGSGPVDFSAGCRGLFGPGAMAVARNARDPYSWECAS